MVRSILGGVEAQLLNATMSEAKYEGHIDHSGDGRIFGWVWDRNEPTKRLEVDLELSSGWRTQVVAGKRRNDLLDVGIGDGCYGFEVKVPFEVTDGETVSVVAKVKGSFFELSKSGRSLTPEFPLRLVAGDVVNNCNLRCPFCVTDYANIKRTRVMNRAVFECLFPLMELVGDGMFWLSCMHEPTIHPEFTSFLRSVPKHLRKKISFTTNLCKKLDDDSLELIANSGVESVRVSIDSLDPETFGILRKGGKLNTFLDNLKRLAQFIEESPEQLPIHFVTMAFKLNAHEIEELVLKTSTILKPARHEIRFMFYVPHAAEWGEKRIMDLEEWEELKSCIGRNSKIRDVQFYDPEPEAHLKFREKPGLADYHHPTEVFGGLATPESYQRVDPRQMGLEIPDEPLRLRLRWDGLLMMETLPEDAFRQAIQDVDANFFRELRNSARRSDVKWVRSKFVES